MVKSLKIERLSKDAFAAFGTVIEAAGAVEIAINQGTTSRFHALCNVDVGTGGGQPIISLFRGTRRPDPIEIQLMERHPLGSQSFMPLSEHDWLVVVAPTNADNSGPDFDGLRVFRASGNQGVSYLRNVWHHPLLILQSQQDFIVIDRAGPDDEDNSANLQEVWSDGVAAVIKPDLGPA